MKDYLMTKQECEKRFEAGENPVYLAFEKWDRIVGNYEFLIDIIANENLEVGFLEKEYDILGVRMVVNFYDGETCALCFFNSMKAYTENYDEDCDGCILRGCDEYSRGDGKYWSKFEDEILNDNYGKAYQWAVKLRDALKKHWKRERRKKCGKRKSVREM